MKPSHDGQPSPIGVAMEWVSRIFAVGLEMVLPGLAGHWLDKKIGTGFLVLLGFGLGITLAIWHLLVMTKSLNSRQGGQRGNSRGRNQSADDDRVGGN